MKHTLKTAKTMMPVALSTLVLVGAAPQVAIAAQNTQSTPVSNVLSGGGIEMMIHRFRLCARL